MDGILQTSFSYGFCGKKYLCILVQNLLKSVLNGLIDDKSLLVLVVASCRSGDKPLCEPMMTQIHKELADYTEWRRLVLVTLHWTLVHRVVVAFGY